MTISSHNWGGEFPIVKHVHQVNGACLVRTLFEQLAYLFWSPVPE
jgi:hypothetical protein